MSESKPEMPEWMKLLVQEDAPPAQQYRQVKLALFSTEYAERWGFGIEGHNSLMTIARLVYILNQLDKAGVDIQGNYRAVNPLNR